MHVCQIGYTKHPVKCVHIRNPIIAQRKVIDCDPKTKNTGIKFITNTTTNAINTVC